MAQCCDEQNIDEERRMKMDEIKYSLSASYFPIDNKLNSYWIPFVLSILPIEDLDYLLDDLNIDVVQICVNTVLKFSSHKDEDRIFVCFTSDLCKSPDPVVIYTIAHEFAHAFLGHVTFITPEMEIEADKQVISWGFEKELVDSELSYIKAREDGVL